MSAEKIASTSRSKTGTYHHDSVGCGALRLLAVIGFRVLLLDIINKVQTTKFIVTHGTDTMIETAQFVAQVESPSH